MRLEELRVHNVGPYRGEHAIDLSPASPERPVVLFGGLNGAGKTTLLEALQLSLYGPQSEPARRSGLAYDEYLFRTLNRASGASEGGSVGLAFTVQEDGQSRRYRVRRTWVGTQRGTKKVRETLDVWVDEQADLVLAEAWAEQVAQFLPPRLAPLFFFDGERIEQLADPEQSADALRTAVGALLGADLVDRLGADLEVLIRRRRVDQAAETDPKLQEMSREQDAAEEGRQKAVQQRATAAAALARAEELFRRADRLYVEQGGKAAEERKANEATRSATDETRQGIARDLRALASGVLPLALVTPLLESAAARAQRASAGADRRIAASVLSAATERLLEDLRQSRVAAKTLARVERWAATEADAFGDEDDAADVKDARSIGPRLEQLLGTTLPDEIARGRGLIERHAEVSERLDALDQALAMTPDEEAVHAASEAREKVLLELGHARGVHESALAAEAEATRQAEHSARELERLLERDRIARGETDDALRFTRQARRTRGQIARFGRRLHARHLERLEKLVLECYRALMRKESLSASLEIDPATYELRLVDGDGAQVRAERLSAGERQLLAVAILWAMGRASGRSLPVAVDTPLGRLDGSHRLRLVERYFPQAAAQVLLFSTDEEIDAELYARLAPYVGRAYRIEHDEIAGTSIRNGYPFAGIDDSAFVEEVTDRSGVSKSRVKRSVAEAVR